MKRILLFLALCAAVCNGQNITAPVTINNGGVTATPNWKAVTAATSDTWTIAVGHGLSNNDPVIFKTTGTLPAVTSDQWTASGNVAVTTVEPGRVYYIRDVAATTFKLANYLGGGSTVDISGTGSGTHYVSVEDRRNLVLGTNSGGAITAQAFDSTLIGGNQRGPFALDLQRGRNAATQVAAAPYSTIINGFNNSIADTGSYLLYGMGTTIASGWANTYAGTGYGSLMGGVDNLISGGQNTAIVFGERMRIYSFGSGQGLVALGSQHLGGGQDAFFGGGFHNLINGVGSTDFGAAGAQIGAVGAGSLLTGAGGSNMQAFGAGVCAYWAGCEFRSNHANKDKAMIRGNLILDTSSASSMGTIANAGTRTNELFLMGYYPASIVAQATGVNTGTNVITGTVAIAANTPVRFSSSDALPSGLAVDTTYYVYNPSGLTFQVTAVANTLPVIVLGTTGTGVLNVLTTWSGSDSAARWCRLFPSKLYTFNFTVEATLKSATTPTYAVWQRRATYLQSATIPSEPTLVGSVQTVGTDVGSNAGSPPASWTCNLTVATDGLHVTVTILNNDGTARNVHATAAFECVEISTL
jgi:hypothetical protein